MKYLGDAGQGVDFCERLVGADAEDAGEAQGVAAIVPLGLHDVVERHFENDFRLDQQLAAPRSPCLGYTALNFSGLALVIARRTRTSYWLPT